MPKARLLASGIIVALLPLVLPAPQAAAQFGGMGGMGGAGGMGAGAPPGADRPRFRDHVLQEGGPRRHSETGDTIVRDVNVVGNRQIKIEQITPLLRTRVGSFYNEETVLADIKRLWDFGAFNNVKEESKKVPGGISVTFHVEELPLISNVIFFGAYGINARELRGRAGLKEGDPINEASIESTRRRLLDYYHEEGFATATIAAEVGFKGNPKENLPPDPFAVIFRISEGELERIDDIRFEGNTIVSDGRLSKIITSRGPLMGVGSYWNNVADIKKIDTDVRILSEYYRGLGYLMADVDRVIEYDETLKWVTVTFLISEGPRYSVNKIHIQGNKFIDESSLRQGLHLNEGQPVNQVEMNQDVDDITYAYGSLGFIYCEVTAEFRLIDEANKVDVTYHIEEGDRWKVGQIFVQIDGEPNLMRETTILNYIDLVEGEFIDRRKLETNRARLMRSELLETNPAIADPPSMRLVPRDKNNLGATR